MNCFPLVISTPDGNLLDAQATGLFLRGGDGDLMILAGHAPLLTTVKAGACRVEFEDGSERSGVIGEGILLVGEDEVSLMSGSFVWDRE